MKINWKMLKSFALIIGVGLASELTGFADVIVQLDGSGYNLYDRRDCITGINNRERDLEDEGVIFENQIDNFIGRKPWRKGGGNGGYYVFRVTEATATTRGRTEYYFQGRRSYDNNCQYSRDHYTNASYVGKILWGERQWTGFTFSPNNWYDSDTFGAYGIIMQWFQYSPAEPPVAVALGKKGGKLAFQVSIHGTKAYFRIEEADDNKWWDVLFHYKFESSASRGSFFSVQYKKADDSNYNTLDWSSASGIQNYNGGIGYYSNGRRNRDKGLRHKVGIYRPGASSIPLEYKVDYLANGTDRSDVDPETTN